jgi:hypothetical protein
MDRYHTDPIVQRLVEQARIDRTSCLGESFALRMRQLVTISDAFISSCRNRLSRDGIIL